MRISAIAIVLAITAITSQALAGWTQSTVEETGAALHWDRSEITISIQNQCNVDFNPINVVKLATDEWSRHGCNIPSFRIVPLTEDADVEVTFEVEGGHLQKTVGVTEPFGDPNTGVLNSATVRLNCEHYDFVDGRPSEEGQVDVVYALIHELGHVLGLDHNDDDRSTMYEYYYLEYYFNGIDSDSTDGICAIYGEVEDSVVVPPVVSPPTADGPSEDESKDEIPICPPEAIECLEDGTYWVEEGCSSASGGSSAPPFATLMLVLVTCMRRRRRG